MSVAPLLADRPATTDAFESVVAGLVPHSFASLDDVTSAVDVLRLRHGMHVGPDVCGQVAYLGVSPGTVSLRVRTIEGMDLVGRDDLAASDRIVEQLDAASVRARALDVRESVGRLTRIRRCRVCLMPLDDVVAQDTHDACDDGVDFTPRRSVIMEWSRGSRRRMVRTIGELDLSRWADDGGTLCLLTLTLPDWWQMVAPTGRDFKRLVEVLRKRWVRAGAGPWRGMWKLEFQRRGAPHLHALMRVPAFVGDEVFETWLARAWADVCVESLEDDDAAAYRAAGEYARHLEHGTDLSWSGVKFSDPRRTSIYFLKHAAPGDGTGSKEYQHVVPDLWQAEGAGPGRFWGVWGLSRARVEVAVDWRTFNQARRVLRHVARAAAARTVMARLRSAGDVAGVWTMRRPRQRGGFGAVGGGWVLVNDAVALAYDLGRALTVMQD
ncbi:hypothetical protein GALL_248640 [mine drainage metagenome]|uniref:Replication-associated protein ORF2/G2P domain-containing protein n=1 Tax=mine drainage metagenome TaxID=410659 RepID=A0A1J5RAR0_9ZZZZ